MRTALIFVAITLFGCGSAEGDDRIRLDVVAASSLTEVFEAIAIEFETSNASIDIAFSFGASSEIAAAIESGASPDLIAVAEPSVLDALMSDDHVVEPVQYFATNRMEIVVPNGNPKDIASLGDLARSDLVVLLCDPAVPCGRYSSQVLANAGVRIAPASFEVNVKGVLGKVALGEADAGIVYVTDVLAAKERVDGVAIPKDKNVVAQYPIAIVERSSDQQEAERFVAFLTSEIGVRILRRHGFGAP